jgi:hypothetical protein
MKTRTLTVLAAAIGLAFSASAMAGMSKAEYKSSKETIEASYQSAKAGCDPLLANAKDICRVDAKGKEAVALSELQAAYKPSNKARYDVRLAKAQAQFSYAKEKCDDLAGNTKDVCVKEAEAARTTANADAKASMKTTKARANASEKIADARKDASEDKREAQYKVAKEKCDALAGGAKDACVNEAKVLYGKS